MTHADRTGRRPPSRSHQDTDTGLLDLQDDALGPGEDLRYEGPISFEDAEDEDGRAADPGGSRVMITALLIGAAVVMLVAVALWLRRDAEPPIRVSQADDAAAALPPARGTTTSLEDRIAAAPSLAPPAPADGPAADQTDPLPEAASEGELEQPGTLSAAVQPPPAPAFVRPAPEPAGQRWIERPAPMPAAVAAPASAAGVRAFVSAGDFEGAARAGIAQARASGQPYGLQLMHACQAESVTRAFAAVADPRLLLLPGNREGCYRMLWGTYPSAPAATSASGSIPAHFASAGPATPVALGPLVGP